MSRIPFCSGSRLTSGYQTSCGQRRCRWVFVMLAMRAPQSQGANEMYGRCQSVSRADSEESKPRGVYLATQQK